MIEFIIADSNKEFREKNKRMIENILMNKDYKYKITIEDDCKNRNQKKDSFRVYVLEENKKNEKWIDTIREKDWSSMIIVTTDNPSRIKEIIEKRWMLIDIIIKDKEYEKYFKRAIKISLNNYEERPNTLKYEYKNTYYNIPISKIKYIEKCKEDKRCRIETIDETYYISRNLSNLEKELPDSFIKSNRSCFINIKNVLSYNNKQNIITFMDGSTYLEVSRSSKKELINKLRKVE